MDSAPQIANPARTVRILHSAILVGLVVIGATFVVVLRLSRRPSPADASSLGLALAALSVALLGVALGALRSRIPERRPDQSLELYWSDARTRGAAVVLWAVVEAAGLLAAVGYFRASGIAPAAALVLSIATMIFLGPARLEADGAA